MKSILIIDDDEAVLNLLGMRLLGRYRAWTFTDPRQAIAKAKLGRPDLVLCDLDMPSMPGPDVAAAIRKDAPHTPIVFLTGLITPSEAKNRSIQGERVIAKGSPDHELLRCIEEIIGA